MHLHKWKVTGPLTKKCLKCGKVKKYTAYIPHNGGMIARNCLMCGRCHASCPPPLSMGDYAKKYAANFGWEPCWGDMPKEYANDWQGKSPWTDFTLQAVEE